MSAPRPELSPQHQQELARAFKLLQKRTLATRLTDLAGKPLSGLMAQFPKSVRSAVDQAVERAISECLKVAMRSLKDTPRRRPATQFASVMAGVAGGVAGVFGAAALPVELPLTTILMLRAIAEIARHYGEDLSTMEARLACVEVFAFGSGDSSRRPDVGYYASRSMLGRLTSQASALLLERGAAGLAAPATAALTSEVATRFGVVVWDKLAASALPLAGAAGAATINMAFMEHFQSIARGHFAVRRLERIYGAETIKERWRELEEGAPAPRKPASRSEET